MKILNIAVVGTSLQFKEFNWHVINQYGNVNFINIPDVKSTQSIRGIELNSWLLLTSGNNLPIEKQKEIISVLNSRIR